MTRLIRTETDEDGKFSYKCQIGEARGRKKEAFLRSVSLALTFDHAAFTSTTGSLNVEYR